MMPLTTGDVLRIMGATTWHKLKSRVVDLGYDLAYLALRIVR